MRKHTFTIYTDNDKIYRYVHDVTRIERGKENDNIRNKKRS